MSEVEKLGGVLNQMLERRGWKQKVLQEMAVQLWGEVVGPEIARSTRAEEFRSGTLFVRTKNAMWSHELGYHKPRIIARLNGRLKQTLVQDIKFYTTRRRGQGDDPTFRDAKPPPPPKVELTQEEKATVEAISRRVSDAELRAALAHAMESCLKAQKARAAQEAKM